MSSRQGGKRWGEYKSTQCNPNSFMQLTRKQVERFKELHARNGELEGYTEDEITEVANGVVNYYLTLLKIWIRMERERDSSKR